MKIMLFAGVSITGTTGGVYAVQSSASLAQTNSWSTVAFLKLTATNMLFVDTNAPATGSRLYRALLQSPPTNMVYIPANALMMGSPTNELERDPNEGPQTRVTLSRGFWIGRFEVTEGEYLNVTGTNPSQFPGDPRRPISSVSWPAATNYCWMRTQRELVAGRLPPGSQYRLPTEAEWECAARAGTSTRFSYGEDPNYTSLTNYAWQNFDGGLTVHPVGQKLPNPLGLYDMMGNVFECRDWLGPLPGGAVTDPQVPPSNPIGWKVMRGGGFDFDGAACRSASRMFFGNHPGLTDWNLDFRVVLAVGPQESPAHVLI